MNVIRIISLVLFGIAVYSQEAPIVIGSVFIFFISPITNLKRDGSEE